MAKRDTYHHDEPIDEVDVEQLDELDEWHKHAEVEEDPQEPHTESVNHPMVLAVGVGSFILVVLTIVVVFGYYKWYTVKVLADRETAKVDWRLLQDREKIDERLSTYTWVAGDQFHGFVATPVENAIDRTLSDYANR